MSIECLLGTGYKPHVIAGVKTHTFIPTAATFSKKAESHCFLNQDVTLPLITQCKVCLGSNCLSLLVIKLKF